MGIMVYPLLVTESRKRMVAEVIPFTVMGRLNIYPALVDHQSKGVT